MLCNQADDGSPPPPKISKLAIVAESDEDKYEYVTNAKCYACNEAEIDTSNPLVCVIDSQWFSPLAIA